MFIRKNPHSVWKNRQNTHDCKYKIMKIIQKYFFLDYQNSLLKHVERAILQAGNWATSDVSNQDIPSPDRFGWQKIEDTWKPVWMTIPEVSKACQELIKCSQKQECTRCKCVKYGLECTPLCKCKCNASSDVQ